MLCFPEIEVGDFYTLTRISLPSKLNEHEHEAARRIPLPLSVNEHEEKNEKGVETEMYLESFHVNKDEQAPRIPLTPSNKQEESFRVKLINKHTVNNDIKVENRIIYAHCVCDELDLTEWSVPFDWLILKK